MIETILGSLLAIALLIYLLDYLGVLDIVGTYVEIFGLLFQGLRWIAAGVARLIRGVVAKS